MKIIYRIGLISLPAPALERRTPPLTQSARSTHNPADHLRPRIPRTTTTTISPLHHPQPPRISADDWRRTRQDRQHPHCSTPKRTSTAILSTISTHRHPAVTTTTTNNSIGERRSHNNNGFLRRQKLCCQRKTRTTQKRMEALKN